MKKFVWCVLSLIVMTLVGIAGVQTQQDLNNEVCEKLQKADQELNNTYNQILSVYKDDKVFIEKLQTAQRAWIAFKDAHLASIYPRSTPGEGNVRTLCSCNILTDMTNERTKALNQWLTGVEEGEVCSGTIKSKYELKRQIKH
jgi:uncharacterized protein YecT (DUF1311 family)